MDKGKFIVFEGLDKSGKSVQFEKLSSYIEGLNIPIYRNYSPSNNQIGSFIRDILEHREICSKELLRLLFVADKMITWERMIEPFLQRGIWVISHRWVLSTLAYGQADGFYLGWLMSINQYVHVPDLTIFIDTPPDECLRRLEKDVGEGDEAQLYEKLPKLQKAYDKYIFLLKSNPCASPNIIVDGKLSPEEVNSKIIKKMQKFVKL